MCLSAISFICRLEREAEEVERMDSEIRTVGNIDEVSAEVLQIFDYAALGHIHKPMKLGSECMPLLRNNAGVFCQ